MSVNSNLLHVYFIPQNKETDNVAINEKNNLKAHSANNKITLVSPYLHIVSNLDPSKSISRGIIISISVHRKHRSSFYCVPGVRGESKAIVIKWGNNFPSSTATES